MNDIIYATYMKHIAHIECSLKIGNHKKNRNMVELTSPNSIGTDGCMYAELFMCYIHGELVDMRDGRIFEQLDKQRGTHVVVVGHAKYVSLCSQPCLICSVWIYLCSVCVCMWRVHVYLPTD